MCLGYLQEQDTENSDAGFEIQVAGSLFPVSVSLHS